MPIPIIALFYLIILLTPLIIAFRIFYVCLKITFEPENNSKIKGDNEKPKRSKS